MIVIAARRPDEGIERQYTVVSDLHFRVEHSMRESAARVGNGLFTKQRLEVEALSLVLQVWRGRRTRRRCDPQPADERQRAELAE